ncbi:unnamed protein product [Brachionus calyciflorus]|uniref:Riboflavin transporter n=1 Tax=Brachionus calyciflorus TaxID=104777 RepID=A0A814DCS6_9BILA|nr:unnamed protein product [Brachionus calyciflorus]
MNQFKDYNSKVKWSTFILISIFTCSSWICATSIWAQLPLIIYETDESWRLPSILTLLAQLAQIVPTIIYPICKFYLPRKILSNKLVIFSKLIVESAAIISLVFFWNRKYFLFGQNRSIGLYIVNILFNIFGGMSTVSFLPFISEYFDKEYITPIYIGEAFSSLVPSSLVFFQGISKNHEICHNTTKMTKNDTYYTLEPVKPESNFSVSVFFTIICIFYMISFVSFIIICMKLKPKIKESEKNTTDENQTFLNSSNENEKKFEEKFEIMYLLVIIFIISFFMYGILLGLQSYSTLAYSHLAFNLSINLGNLLLPMVIFFSIVSIESSLKTITIQFLIGLLFSIWIVYVSFYSPCPPLVKHWSGESIIVIAWILAECFFLRLRSVIATRLEKFGEKVLLILGWVTLLGQMCGGLVVYLLVEIFQIFHSRPSCTENLSYCNF